MIFDIVVAAVIFISSIIAFLRGFIRETLTILGVVGGAFAAMYAGPLLSPTVRGWFGVKEAGAAAADAAEKPEKIFGILPPEVAADIAAYGGVFVLVVIVLSVVSHMLSGWAKAVGLGALDRSFGVLFGIARAVVLLALLYLPVYVMVNEETRDGWFVDSKTRVYVEASAGWAKKLLPESVTRDMQKKAEDGIGKAAREKLQQLDVLQQEEGNGVGDPAPASEEDGANYQDGQRRDLNELIDDSFNQ